MFRKTVTVADSQRVFVLQDKTFKTVLKTGTHKLWDMNNKLDFISFNLNDLYFSNDNAIRMYRKHDELAEYIHHWKLDHSEVGLLYFNDMLQGVVAPGEHLYLWKDAGELKLEKINIDQNIELDEKQFRLIKRSGANSSANLIRSATQLASKPVADICIAQQHIGLLYIDGKYVKQLASGQYGFWQLNHSVEVKIFDQRNQMLEISGQEILSKDRVSLRINLSANIRVFDALLASSRVDNVNDFAYKALQLALREAVGTKTLDDILIDKLYVNETVKELVVEQLKSIGVSLESIGVKDIILPGEMKAILNQVVEAQKAAEANVIKRREETAATRSLHNTAKVMENNPTLLRLKELEALEKVAEKIDNLNVYGGLDGLMNGVVKIA